MKKVIFVAIFTLLCSQTFAQESKYKVVKLYTDILYSNERIFKIKQLNILPVIACAVISENKNFQEFQFTGFSHTIRSFNIYYETNTSFSLRYSYNLRLFKSKQWAISPSIGLGAVPYFESRTRNPISNIINPSKNWEAGIGGEIIPRINWNISETVFIDLNIPIRIGDLSFEYSKVKNPNVPVRQQADTQLGVDEFLPQGLRIQLGLGIKF